MVGDVNALLNQDRIQSSPDDTYALSVPTRTLLNRDPVSIDLMPGAEPPLPEAQRRPVEPHQDQSNRISRGEDGP